VTKITANAQLTAELVKECRNIQGISLIQAKRVLYLEHVDRQIKLLEKNPNRMATRGDLAAAMKMMMKITGNSK